MSEGTPAPGEPGIGEYLAGYRLDEMIGRGGMAVVYRAYDERLGRSVALKVLNPRLGRDDAFRRRFIRESRAAASLDHPNIVPIFEAGEASGLLFIAMRYVQGRDVLTIIEEQGMLPAARACHMVIQVAAALDAAHERGLVHRDVKPANMLRDAATGDDQPDHVYLSDFGLSKRWTAASDITSQGEFLGTMDYVAPEQIEGRPVDGRSDQYGLACSAFEMLSGAPPFRRDETMAIMWAQVSSVPPALTSRRPDLPAGVDTVMAKALAKAPDDRYRTCLEFAFALRSACTPGRGTGAPRVAGPAPREHQPTRPVSHEDLAAAASAAAAGPPGGPVHPGGLPPARQPGGELPARQPSARQPGSEPPGGPVHDDTELAGLPPATPPPVTPSPAAPGVGPPHEPTEHIGLPAADPPRPPPGPQPSDGPPAPAAPGRWPAPPGPAGYGQPPRMQRSGRTRAVIIVACVAVLGAIGGGYVLFGGSGAGAALTAPACTTKAVAAGILPRTHGHLVSTGGRPFDAAVTSQGYGFVSLTSALAIMRTTGSAPALIRTIPLSQALGVALTHDQKYLLVSGLSGVMVFRVSDLEQGLSTPVGTLTSPGSRAVQVAVSPDSNYAFVTLEDSGQVAVFNLRRALLSGFGPGDLAGMIRVAPGPVGIVTSPDGHYVYVASGLATPAGKSGQGSLTVIDLLKAETRPASSVRSVVRAGCGPDRVAVSPDGADVWVTVGGGDALVAYSAAKLLSDPQHALIARVAVGELPLGLVFFNHGSRIMVADSNRDGVPGRTSNLAVIDVQKALAGQPALLGTVRSGAVPRQFALYPGGKLLLVTDTGSGQVQAIKIAHLP